MEFDHLRAFVAVADAGGFSRAALLTHTTQPTLSRQVKALEVELERQLFDRLGRKVALTAFGQEVLERARSLLEEADSLASAGREGHAKLTGVLRLGAADSVVLNRLPRIIRRFQKGHPGVRVHVRTAASPEILAWVREGKVDVGLCMLPDVHPGLTLEPLWEDGFITIAHKNHALAGRSASLAALAAERQIAINPDTLSHQVITGAFQSAGLPFVPDMFFDTFHLIVEFVSAGIGVGVVSETMAASALRRKQVARVRVKEIDRLTRRLGLALHGDRDLHGPLGAFLEEAERQA